MTTTSTVAVTIVILALGSSKGLVTLARGQTAATSIWDGVYTEDQTKRGLVVYQDRCLSCHGEKLDGGAAPALSGDDFMADWGGRSVGDLFQRTQLAMPADDPGTLKPKETADVLAYVFSINKFPAGQTELSADRDALKQIRIQPKK